MTVFEKTGKVALGSRLRILSARMTDDAARIYQMYEVDFSPKWFPVFFLLAQEGEKSVTELAIEVGHSQPSVTKIIKEMIAAGLVQEKLQVDDKRKTVAELTQKGREVAAKVQLQSEDVDLAIDALIAESNHNLWEALAEWEYLLDQESLLRRVQQQKKRRESKDVRIVPYEDKYQSAYKALNVEWISTFFKMEEADYKALDHPHEYILDKGGMIFVALYKDEPLGVCALIKCNEGPYGFELAKMAVSPKAQGKNIGWLLGMAAIDAARQAGASKIFLESNTMLKPAIGLYQKLGFQKIVGIPSPYERCNIQMELSLTHQ
ncbi:bifunctional helix-turn-helix transcriptional regulator/GNAT family N-acetyltransferase [Spirosoma linguale]|uniref:Transcriptional regulator, MarR family with acetyltransferase activity n=1 Tax=Spirosoma linguale (strain ATCC 33905 / DSM 74 / LMG 10896 / Claus 1) TaxID=504472 RepID=D2QTB0_SPILD|nr:transcriptional regulator, MarR family with acetyltransferase activity [Spirosoma linguale DSM 74]